MRWAAVTAVAGCIATLLPGPVAHAVPAAPAAPAPADCQPQRGAMTKEMITDVPWGQVSLNLTRVHEKATGAGIKVAVIDSGVTAANPQLQGRVLPGIDLTKTGQDDCVGHGTAVAGIIAGKRGISPFYGVAPDAQILPIKFTKGATGADSRLAAKGIDEAVKAGAQVINMSTQSVADDPSLRQAVQRALAKNVVIVAAAGNINPEKGVNAQLMYPSGYNGVISVGAIDLSGQITKFSNPKTPITVIAPGKDIITTTPDGNYSVVQGTSFAAPFVTGVVALIKQTHPKLTPAAIRARLEATAQGGKGDGSGAGIVNPYEAVTAVLSGNPRPGNGGGQVTGVAAPVEIVRPEKTDPLTKNVALGIAGGAIGLAALVIAGGLLIPQGRRRGWKPGQVTVPSGEPTGTARRVR